MNGAEQKEYADMMRMMKILKNLKQCTQKMCNIENKEYKRFHKMLYAELPKNPTQKQLEKTYKRLIKSRETSSLSVCQFDKCNVDARGSLEIVLSDLKKYDTKLYREGKKLIAKKDVSSRDYMNFLTQALSTIPKYINMEWMMK